MGTTTGSGVVSSLGGSEGFSFGGIGDSGGGIRAGGGMMMDGGGRKGSAIGVGA